MRSSVAWRKMWSAVEAVLARQARGGARPRLWAKGEMLEQRVLLAGQGFDFPGQWYAAGRMPCSVTAADVDGDGAVDLITANFGSDTVSVLRNLGDGTFAAQVTYVVGNVPLSVTAADVDGDGAVDLITANDGSDTVSVLRNLGDGTFAAQVTYVVGDTPYSVTAADVDGDGAVDLITANGSDTVSVLRNLGDGTFAAQVTYVVGDAPLSVTAADVDRDGAVDLITANYGSDTVSVLRNLGDGTFAAQVTYVVGAYPRSVTAADVDRDGAVDLITANWSDTVSVLRNLGDGTFATQLVTYVVGAYPRSVTAADVDGDGAVDLITANYGSDTVSVLRNLGDGTFAAQVTYVVGDAPLSVTAADVDGDGAVDLITANYGSNTVSVLRNLGDGTFAAQVTYVVGDTPYSVTAADVDGDGAVDLITANDGSDTVSVLRNLGDGTFAAQVTYVVGDGPLSVTAADVDGDGAVDLITANYGSDTVSVLRNLGDGTFAAQVTYVVGNAPLSVTAADVDRDGAVDLITANFGSATVSVLRNLGDGTFAAQVPYTVGSGPRPVTAVDVDGDGAVDLVTPSPDSNTVSVLRNVGDGTFASQVIYGVGNGPGRVAAADVDGDGAVDLITANRNSDTVSVLLNLRRPRNVKMPDLAPLRVAAIRPSDTSRPFGIAYTMTNVGDVSAEGQWIDEVYLSADPILDPATDHLLCTIPQFHNLAPGESYTTCVSAAFPNAGDYYLIVRLNATGSMEEQHNGVSNVLVGDFFSLSPAAQGQLTLESAGLDNADYGIGQRTLAHLRVHNDSPFDIAVPVQHALYLSTDQTWDWRDTLLAQFDQPFGMQPWDTVELSGTCAVPPVLPGTYYVLAKVDALNAVAEGDAGEADNTCVVGTVIIKSVSLESGVSVEGVLSSAMPWMSYRIDVGADDSEVRIYLDGSRGANELYVARDRMPTRSSYDYRYSAPFASNQRVAIPRAAAGTYYILAYGTGMASTDTAYSLTAWVYEEAQVDAIDPDAVGNDGIVVFRLAGHCLYKLSSPQLEGPDGTLIEPLQTSLLPNGEYLARFDLRMVPAGEYRLITPDGNSIAGSRFIAAGQPLAASSDGAPSIQVNQAASSWSVVPPVGGVEMHLTGPEDARPGRTIRLDIDWGNVWAADSIYAPLWVLSVEPAGVVLSGGSGPTAEGDFVCEIADGGTMKYTLLHGDRRRTVIYATIPADAKVDDTYTFTLSLLPDHYPIGGYIDVNGASQGTNGAAPLSLSTYVSSDLESTLASADPTADQAASVSVLESGKVRIWKIAGGAMPVMVTDPSQIYDEDTAVILHGWNNGRSSFDTPEVFANLSNVAWMRTMGWALDAASGGPRQVLLVDAGPYLNTGLFYNAAVWNIDAAGAEVAAKISALGLSPGNIHFIGHSLGAHVAGVAAAILGHVKQLTALDPAAPLVRPRFNQSSAHYVDMYNSSSLGMDIASRAGTENFVLMVPSSVTGFFADSYHGYAPAWYTQTIVNAGNMFNNLGFNRSSSGAVQHGMITLNGGLINLDSRTWAIYRDPRQIAAAFSNKLTVRVVGSLDPNDKTGPVGWGDEAYVRQENRMQYQVEFENLPTATASAQEVVVTDQLDVNLDWATFELHEIAFGSQVIALPPGTTQCDTVTEYNVGGLDLLVRTLVELDINTGVIEAHFTCADPATGTWPTDPYAGFLPPDDESGLGEGRIVYSVRPRVGVPGGTVVANQASIVFDTNPAIETPVVKNTIDAGVPSSAVVPLLAEIVETEFVVSWTGSDDAGGSGIASYDVYSSDNGGLPTLWQSATTATSAVFTGQPGHTYRFYSIAIDNVGHTEAAPASADAQVTVVTNRVPTNITLSGTSIAENQSAGTIVGTLNTTDPDVGDTFAYTLVPGIGSADNASFEIVGNQLKTAVRFDYEARTNYSIRVRATDAGGLSYEKQFTITVTDDTADLRGQFGLVSGKTVASAPLQDANGDQVIFTLTGGGGGKVYGFGNTFEEIVLMGTTAKSMLTIRVTKGIGGDGQVTIGDLTSDGVLKGIAASAAIVSGQVRLNTLNQPAGTTAVSIQFLQLRDGSIDSQNLPIASLKLLDWQDSDGNPDTLTAPSIGSITVSGRKNNAKTATSEYLAGDIDASVTVAGGIGSIKVAGSITGTIRSGKDVKGNGIGSIAAGGNISGATIVTTGSIGKFSAAALLDSDILVGVTSNFAGQFAGHGDFANTAAKLGSLTVSGKKLPKGSSYPAYVSGVHLSAPSIGTMKLANVDSAAGAIQANVLADTGTLTVTALNPQVGGVTVLPAGTWKPGKAGRPDVFDVV